MRQMDLDFTEMSFTRNWFRLRNLSVFREHVHPEWTGKPITYLELGIFEAQSLCWMLQHILTHPDARAVGVDPWLMTKKLDAATMEAVMHRAIRNIRVQTRPNSTDGTLPATGGEGSSKCELFRANSAEFLRGVLRHRKRWGGLTRESVDLCLVDGNHNALAVQDDCRMVYQVLKPGGWLILDDVSNDFYKEDHVKQGLDAFLLEAGGKVECVFKGRYVEAYRKL